MIIPVYKPLGASSHQLAKKVGDLYNEKATHTGTLDPMAEGVLVVLTDADRFSKEKWSDVKKTYDFEILLGFTTDSHDLLGLVTTNMQETNSKNINPEGIKNILKEIQKKDYQIIPEFSAKRYKGKSYFDFAKTGEELPESRQENEIYSLQLQEVLEIHKDNLFNSIFTKLSFISGDFRQIEIINQWKSIEKNTSIDYFFILKCQATTSKRTYIRSIVRDLSYSLQVPATTFSISRIANGSFQIKDCICLVP